MNVLYDIRDYILDNLTLVISGGISVMLIFGYLYFTVSTILPNWQIRADLARQVISAQEILTRNELGQQSIPNSLQMGIVNTQEQINDLGTVFMSEAQAASTLNNLYRYAERSGVNIIDLQAQPSAEVNDKTIYDVRTFQIQVDGNMPDLLSFGGRISEASEISFAIANVTIGGQTQSDTSQHSLIMDIKIYTSPYALETAVSESTQKLQTPAPIPTLMPAPVTEPTAEAPTLEESSQAVLQEQIDEQWAAENWVEVIEIIGQLTAVGITNDEMTRKLYSAHVNYGYQLLDQQNFTMAQNAFTQALTTSANGFEALAGQQLARLIPQLNISWSNQDWLGTISLLEQILALDPSLNEMSEKLYAAYVNYGSQLVAQQQIEAARSAYEHALSIKPSGIEAQNGLQSLAATTYIVRGGDTLYSIATRFGITVDAIKSANGLTSNDISPNQQLIIPR